MNYIIGFAVWTFIGLGIGMAMRMVYRVAQTDRFLSLTFGFFGAFIGGMLGTSAYVHHDPNPFRFGGILGALLGAVFFSACYHFTTDKGV